MSQNRKENTSGKGTFIAIGLCVAFYLGWTQYLNQKYPDHNKPRATTEAPTTNTTAPVTSAAPSAASSVAAPQAPAGTPASPAPVAVQALAPKLSAEDLKFETPDATFVFSQELASPTSIKLKSYRQTNDFNSPAIELLHRPLIVEAISSAQAPTKTSALDYTATREKNKITFTRQDGPWKVTQEWIIPEAGYDTKLSTTWTNTAAEAKPLAATVLFEMGANLDVAKKSFFAAGSPGEAPRFLSQADGSDEFKNIEAFCKDQAFEMVSKNKKLDFFGFDHHYFAAAFVPNSAANYRTTFSSQANGLCSIITTVSTDFGSVAAGQSSKMSWDTWFGPKDVELLSAFNPHLKTTLGLGWLDMIAHPLLLSIKGLYKFTGNYGIAIILLTLLLKIMFYPLARQAAISAAKMKKLNPEMTKLREKYKSDPQRMQMELMKFMGQHKINPMKGCLPILPTIPVFFALFRVLSASIDLRHAPFYGWILDLSSKDPYLVTPIILTGCMFIQQRLTPMTGMDPTQEKVMMFMPLIFGVMMISLPSGLVLYMLTNTIVSIAQQQYLNKKLAATV